MKAFKTTLITSIGGAKAISRMLVASVVIALATSAWACSSFVDSSSAESVDDWNPNPYALYRYSPANISDTSDSVVYGDLEDNSAVARSGYTDPDWERAEILPERSGEPSVPAATDRVLEIPQALSWVNTAAATRIPGAGD